MITNARRFGVAIPREVAARAWLGFIRADLVRFARDAMFTVFRDQEQEFRWSGMRGGVRLSDSNVLYMHMQPGYYICNDIQLLRSSLPFKCVRE